MKRILSFILAAAIISSAPAAFAENDGYASQEQDAEYGDIFTNEITETEDEFAYNDVIEITEASDGLISDEYNAEEGLVIEEIEGQDMAYSANNVPQYLFDYEYYATKYEDLANAFGRNKSKLYNHWLTNGKREGRSPSPVYDPDYYLNNNGDLRNAFGTDYAALYNHFVTYGINEFRKSSPIYDGGYYKSHYSDLQNAFGNKSSSYISHFMSNGMNEGRQASDDFNVEDYKSRYSDLQNAFGNNLKRYYYHYMEYGVTEGRNGKPSGNNSPTEVPDTTSNKSTQQNNTSQNGRTAWVKTSGSNLNMRASASTSSRIVCKVPNGSRITVYGNPSKNFYKAAYNGRTGYVSAGYVTFSSSSSPSYSGGRIVDNWSKVSLLKQGSKTCKATAVAQSLNIIVCANRYTMAEMGNSNCKSINGNTYRGSDGNVYDATYKTDSYRGSASEQMSKINAAISAGLPIIVAVHKKSSGTKHHWVTLIGRNSNTYDIIDPATGTKRTMSSAGYAFGLADYSNGYHYGYVSFARR